MSVETRAVRPDTVRAALYQRVSTAEQSVERQNEANRAAAAANDWQAIEYADPGQSASQFAGPHGGANREDWQRLLADLDAGQIDVLVLWTPSRGNRQLAEWAELLDTCRTRGVLIHITSERHTFDLSIPREWKTLASAGVDAAGESENMSMEIRNGKEDGRKAGRPQGGVAFGVHRVRDPEKARHAFLRDEPDEKTGPVVRAIVLAVGAGEAYLEIAEALNDGRLNLDGTIGTGPGSQSPLPPSAGHKRPGRKGWTRSTVVDIARNRRYAEVGVVTEDEALAARARVGDGKRKGEKPRAMRFRYSQVMTCSVCGENVRGITDAAVDRYRCAGKGHVSVKTDVADQFLDEVCIGLLVRDAPGLFEHADEAGSAAARAEAARLQARLDEAAGSYAAGRITLAQLEQITATLRPKADAASKRADDLAKPSALIGLPGGTRAEVERRWNALSLPARKAAVRVLLPNAQLHPGHKVIDERVTWD
jgi:site-specific DNA recombinase